MSEKKKVLVVDDEPDIVTWITTIFEDNGYETISAENGAEGFEKAKTEHPDLITLDISMDKESGMRALKNLQKSEETSAIPIIIITGVSPDLKRFIDRTRQVQKPAAFLEKPIDKDELLDIAKKVIN
ncbi:MAG: response regulator [candidate division Zixibacteria bacterium]|nr:response regulator [candidate division Zixibacteria bacterium]